MQITKLINFFFVLSFVFLSQANAFEVEPYLGIIAKGKSDTNFVEHGTLPSYDYYLRGPGHVYGNGYGLRLGVSLIRLFGLGYQYERGHMTVITRAGTFGSFTPASWEDAYTRTLHGPMVYLSPVSWLKIGAAYYLVSLKDNSADLDYSGVNTNNGDTLKGKGIGAFLRLRFGNAQLSFEFRKIDTPKLHDARLSTGTDSFRINEEKWSELFVSIGIPFSLFGGESSRSHSKE
ncbi:MAG: hypothetical protein A2X86_10415 [Bdellovibrionales bacterium GWA2_49_15]|nr:MAG: hypothetical protein A2X86_10415 [Bdellovibrionales bacterium GWA2_49_15]HAZ14742.1 hypothetical protein [Bdellovibrionales bacterium]